MSHPDKHASLPRALTLALTLALATACSRPPAQPPAETPPPQQENPAPAEALIKATIHTTQDPLPPQLPPSAFAFPDPGAGFAAVGPNLLTTTDQGQTWTQIATLDTAITQLDFPTASQGWAVTETRQLLTTTDAGRTWRPTGHIARQIDFVSPDHGFRLDGTTLYTTADGGQTWTQTGPSPCGDADSRWSSAFSFSSPQDGWTACAGQPGVGMQGKSVYRTRDGGANWDLTANVPVPANNTEGKVGQLPAGGYLSTIYFLDEQHGWLGLSRGALFTTTDGGVTWKGADGPMGRYERFIAGVQFLTPDRGYVVDMGILYTTADGGQTWNPILPALAPAAPLPLQMLDARRWVAAGTRLEGGAILWTADAGQTWRRAGLLPEDYVDALLFNADAQKGWALGHHWTPDASYMQTVYWTEDGGATWAPRFQRTGVTFASFTEVAPQTLIASTNTGEIHISRDGGQTFTPLTDAAQEPSTAARFINKEKGWRTRDFALEATTDGGRTWAPVGPKTRVVDYDLLPDGSAWVVGGEIREGGHKSELFFTPDWGTTWTRFDLGPLPGAGAVRCADRNTCLAIIGDGNRYLTTDGGRTWEPRP